MTDEEIVILVQNGEVNKYEDIVKRFQRPLLSYVRKMINQSIEEAEDVVQEILIKGYVNIQGFDSSKKFSSWLFRIAHNQCIDYFRKKRIKKESLDEREEWINPNEKLFEELFIDRETKSYIARAITKLDDKYKEVVVLYYFESKSYEEIADILHVPTSNVGVLLFRAKSKLKIILKKHE